MPVDMLKACAAVFVSHACRAGTAVLRAVLPKGSERASVLSQRHHAAADAKV